MTITLPYPPSANRYWRHVVVRGQARVLLSAEAREYRATVGRIAMIKRLRPASGPVVVTLRFYRPRRSGDLDNRLKQVLDALQGWAFADDAQVVELHAVRRDDKDMPRVEVAVTGVSEC